MSFLFQIYAISVSAARIPQRGITPLQQKKKRELSFSTIRSSFMQQQRRRRRLVLLLSALAALFCLQVVAAAAQEWRPKRPLEDPTPIDFVKDVLQSPQDYCNVFVCALYMYISDH